MQAGALFAGPRCPTQRPDGKDLSAGGHMFEFDALTGACQPNRVLPKGVTNPQAVCGYVVTNGRHDALRGATGGVHLGCVVGLGDLDVPAIWQLAHGPLDQVEKKGHAKTKVWNDGHARAGSVCGQGSLWEGSRGADDQGSVSYTHLTLPTICSV